MPNSRVSQSLRPFTRKPTPPVRSAHPLYQVNLARQRLSRPVSKPGLLDGLSGKLGRPARIIASCFGVFIFLVMVAFLSALGLFGFTAITILSNF
jgi:hypothetical protein